jgi:uncharacterized repeat protein (TIGR01451 family)
MGIAPNGHLGNLDTTDAGAEFRFGNQPRRSVTSTQVCLFAPRFVTIRQELTPVGYEGAVPAIAMASSSGLGLNCTRLPANAVHEVVPPMSVLARVSPRGTRSREGVHELELFRGAPLVIAHVDGLAIQATVIEPAGFTQFRDQCKPNDPLVLVKTAEPREAQPGDVVTITLKFINYGSLPARDIVVSDSLSPRLEYLSGTSCGDRPTIFTQETNESGTVILRWAVNGEIPAGQSGKVQFQVRVR